MKVRKVTGLLLCGTMALSLAACGSSSTAATDSSVAATSAAAAATDSSVAATSAAAGSASSETASAATSGDGSQMRIAWWGSQARHNATIEALDTYAADNGTTFSYEYNSWDSYFEDLATETVGNNLPDIIQMSTTDIINYAQNGQIIDLQSYIDDGTIDTSKIEAASLDGGKVDGKEVGITTGVNTVTVAYNKDIFDQAGVAYPEDDWTWSEYIDDAKQIYEKTGIQSDIPFLAEARWVVETWVRSYGYDLFSEDGQSLPWADDAKVTGAIASAMQDVRDGIEAGYFIDPEVQVAWSTTEDQYVVQGKSAMSFILSNYYGTYCTTLGSDLGMAMLPKMDDGTQTGMYLNSNMYWCITSNSKDPAASAKVVNYLINDKDAALIIGTDRGVSLNSDIRDELSTSDKTDSYTKNTIEYVSKVSSEVNKTNPADPANSAEAIAVLKDDYTSVCYGEMTPEDCVNDFITQAASILPQ